MTAGRYGLGKVVYFANQTDKLCYTNGHEDFRNLFGNAVEWVKSGEFQFRAKLRAACISPGCRKREIQKKVFCRL